MGSSHRRPGKTGRDRRNREAEDPSQRMVLVAARLRTGYYLTDEIARATALQMIRTTADWARPDSGPPGL